MDMGKTLLLLDGMALLYRAHFAFITNPIRNSKGFNTSALHGLLNVVLDLRSTHQPTHMAMALDTAAPTARHLLFPEYKAQREAMPEELAASIPLVHRLCEALCLPLVFLDGYEADDIIGTLARRAETEGFTTYMVTPDKDFSQLVTEHTYLLKPGRKGGAAEVEGVQETCKRWEIETPSQVIDILGLWGDASDNIPGVPGVGQKTATKLMAEYGSLEAVLEAACSIKGKLGERLREHGDQARLSRKLATIDVEVPLGHDLAALEIKEPNVTLLEPLLAELEFRSLAKRLLQSVGNFQDETGKQRQAGQNEQLELLGQLMSQEVETEDPKSTQENALTLETYEHQFECLTDETSLRHWAKQWMKQEWLALDTETTDLDPKKAQLLGLSICCESGVACYIPVGGSQPIPEETLRAILQPVLAHKGIGKVGHHLKFDLSVLVWQGWEIQGPLWDTMVAHRLLKQDQRHGLDFLAKVYLNYDPISIESLIGPKGKDQKTMDQVDLATLAKYAAEDAEVTWRLRQSLLKPLKDAGQEHLFHEVEMPLIPVLVSMEKEGVRLDTDAMVQFSDQLLQQMTHLEQRVYELAGMNFNIASPKQLGEVLFDHLKLVEKPKKTRTGQYATNENVLQQLASEHAIVQTILDYRMVSKLRSTYAEALPQNIHAGTGRIHTTFYQVATATGRLSSQSPNLQNIPIRHALGQEIRKAFVPRQEGFTLLSADYSQIELRVMASMSGDPSMKAAFESGQDIHAATAAHVFHVEAEAVTEEMRRKAKMVNFGVLYGMSAFGLSQRLGISRKDASEIIDHYWASFPSIKAYMDRTVEQARERGYVETLLGRRRYLPDIQSANGTIRAMAERNAINSPIQGSAADMIKAAMVLVWKAFSRKSFASRLILQVHDELIFDAKLDELDQIKAMIRECMVQALPLDVPVEVDIGDGPHWLAAH